MSDTPETDAARKILQMFYDNGKLDVGIESIFLDMTKLEQQRDEAFKLYNAAVIGTKLIDKDLNEAEEQRDRLKHELAEVLQQRDEWKANHDNQVAINRILRDRPDMGERAKMVDELIQQHDRLAEEQNILKQCLSAMPVGYIPTHTAENLPEMIDDLAKALAEETTERENLELELAAVKEQRDRVAEAIRIIMADYRLDGRVSAEADMLASEALAAVKEKQTKESQSCPECDALASHGCNDGPCETHKL
jgi:hypothetical protein